MFLVALRLFLIPTVLYRHLAMPCSKERLHLNVRSFFLGATPGRPLRGLHPESPPPLVSLQCLHAPDRAPTACQMVLDISLSINNQNVQFLPSRRPSGRRWRQISRALSPALLTSL